MNVVKFVTAQLHRAQLSPDDNDDAVENVVRVVQVVETSEGSQLQDHLQGEHAGEDDVANLQNVSQLLWLREKAMDGRGKKNGWKDSRMFYDYRVKKIVCFMARSLFVQFNQWLSYRFTNISIMVSEWGKK